MCRWTVNTSSHLHVGVLILEYVILFFISTVSLYCPATSVIAFINALLGAKLNVVHSPTVAW